MTGRFSQYVDNTIVVRVETLARKGQGKQTAGDVRTASDEPMEARMRSKTLIAILTVAIGFLMATNPVVADAAKQITGAQVKNNSLTGKDVRNGSLRKKDLPSPLTADSATHAAGASNASHLAGQPAVTYLERAAQGTLAGPVNVPAGNAPVLVIGAVSLTVPPGVSFARVSASSTLVGGDNLVAIWFQVDNPTCSVSSGAGFDSRPIDDTTPSRASLSYSLVIPVTAGVHTFVLCAAAVAATASVQNSMNVETIAAGATGGTTLKTVQRKH